MHVIIAADSFKGSCSAQTVVATIERGVHAVFPKAKTTCIPVADGGEGTVAALVAAVGGRTVTLEVQDPLGRPIRAAYGVLPDGTAVVETAAASGLPLLKPGERNAMAASTFGTGQLMRHALEHGAKQLILGLGGSATTDGGAGALQALGAAFLDPSGAPLPPGGAALARLARIDTSGLIPQVQACRLVLACDVRNKLCGPEGAAAVFGPQKGASPQQVQILDAALSHYAQVLRDQLGSDAASRNGSGAAGGLGCGLLAFFPTDIRSGIDLVLDLARFDQAVAQADLVITGEGCLDAQSAYGKVPAGVARRTKAIRDIPVLAIGGAIKPGAEALYACGVDSMMSAVSQIITLDAAMARAEDALLDSTVRMMRLLRAGSTLKIHKEEFL